MLRTQEAFENGGAIASSAPMRAAVDARSGKQRQKAVLGYRYALLREGLSRVLAGLGLEVVQEADWPHVVSAIREHQPVITLVDDSLIDEHADCLRVISQYHPRAPVAVLALPDDRGLAAALKAGVSGYLSVDTSLAEFARSVKLLLAGDIVISRELAVELRHLVDERRDNACLVSDREREIVGLVAEGWTNKEIGHYLMVTQHTVKAHMRHILEKLNLRNRQQVVAYAIRNGWCSDVPPDPDGHFEKAKATAVSSVRLS